MKRANYPEQAGSKSPGRSEEAARTIDRMPMSLHDQVLKIIADSAAGVVGQLDTALSKNPHNERAS
jgi:hypothetical protein